MTRNKKTATPPRANIPNPSPALPRWQLIIILILPFILYFNTLGHDYVLDDAIVITENQFTKQGLDGIGDILSKETFVGYFGVQKSLVAGGRYRPLSLVTFAIEYELFGLNPGVSHFINILLYALTGLLILMLFFRLFNKSKYANFQYTVPFLTAVLFLVHPIHTEAVANIKGRDEILGLLFSIWSIFLLIKYIDRKKTIYLLGALGIFFLGLLSKENAYTFLAIVPAVLYIFTPLKNKKIIQYSAYYLGVIVIGLVIRQAVIGGLEVSGNNDLMNDPFIEATATQKYATIFYTLAKYLQLLFVPYPLSHDYYPYQIPLKNFSDPIVLFSIILYAAMGLYAIFGVIKKSLPAFAIFLYLIPLSVVSNIVFPVGTFMSERFIYMSSLGFCLLVAIYLGYLQQFVRNQFRGISSVESYPATNINIWIRSLFHQNTIGASLLILAIVAFSVLTIARNPVWKNNEKLFLTDVENAPNSAKINNAAGGVLFEKAVSSADIQLRNELMAQSFEYLSKSVEINPNYGAAWTTLGNIYYYLYNDIDKAIESYTRANDQKSYGNLLIITKELVAKNEYPEALKAIAILKNVPEFAGDAYVQEGLVYAKRDNNLDKAIELFNHALKLNPANADAYLNLGVAYGFKNQPQEAIKYMELAVKYNPNDLNTNRNLANAYRAVGDQAKAQFYENRARSLEQSQ